MKIARREFGSVAINGGLVAIGGAIDKGTTYTDAVEYLTDIEAGSWIRKGSMHAKVYTQCVVTVNSTTMLLTGGLEPSQYGKRTWFYDIEKEIITEGPQLMEKRWSHGCAMLRMGETDAIIVAGGYNGSEYFSSVEILDLSKIEKGWREGPPLSVELSLGYMIGHHNSVYFIGGANNKALK